MVHRKQSLDGKPVSTVSCLKFNLENHNLIFFLFFSSRLTSTGDDDNEGHSEHETSWDELDERYEQYMAARERLQEFPGRIPNRKKRKEGKKTKVFFNLLIIVFEPRDWHGAECIVELPNQMTIRKIWCIL